MRKRQKPDDISPILREGLRRLDVPETSPDFDNRVLGAVAGARREFVQHSREVNREVLPVMAIALAAACLWAVYLFPLVNRKESWAPSHMALRQDQLSEPYSDTDGASDPTGFVTLNCGSNDW